MQCLFNRQLSIKGGVLFKILWFLLLAVACEDSNDPKVVGVQDGDTIEILWEGETQKVRLEGIDCPEKRQPFGQRAKQFTADFCYGKHIKLIDTEKIDKYGRILGTVIVDKKVLNEELLRAGFAWHYVKYSNNEFYAVLEAEARKNGYGLWADPNPIPPWEFRKTGTKKNTE